MLQLDGSLKGCCSSTRVFFCVCVRISSFVLIQCAILMCGLRRDTTLYNYIMCYARSATARVDTIIVALPAGRQPSTETRRPGLGAAREGLLQTHLDACTLLSPERAPEAGAASRRAPDGADAPGRTSPCQVRVRPPRRRVRRQGLGLLHLIKVDLDQECRSNDN